MPYSLLYAKQNLRDRHVMWINLTECDIVWSFLLCRPTELYLYFLHASYKNYQHGSKTQVFLRFKWRSSLHSDTPSIDPLRKRWPSLNRYFIIIIISKENDITGQFVEMSEQQTTRRYTDCNEKLIIIRKKFQVGNERRKCCEMRWR